MRIALVACPFLFACGGDDAPADAAPDAYDTARCLITGNYGALGMKTGTAGNTGGATTATITLDMGPPRDTFFVKLVPSKGVFASGVMPGTFSISGVDAEYNNCGLCVHIIADIVTGSGPSKFYFAESGTVTLSSTTAPITGSASNLVLREVDINSGAFVANGCRGSIESISFTTM